MNTWITPTDVDAVIKSFMFVNEGDAATENLILAIGAELLDISVDTMAERIGFEDKYVVEIYLNGIYWDSTYTTNKAEAEKLKAEIEDETYSIWDRVNGDALMQFIREYKIANEDDIKVTAEIVKGGV
jgi:hypothetical protein